MRRLSSIPLLVALVVTMGLVPSGVQHSRAQEAATPSAGTPSPVGVGHRTRGATGHPLGHHNRHEAAQTTKPHTQGSGEGLVVTSGPTGLVAVDAATGAERWRVEQPASASTPLVRREVYVGTAGEGVKAFDASDRGESCGSFSRVTPRCRTTHRQTASMRRPSSRMACSTPVKAAYGGLYALDPATGKEQWHVDTHGATWVGTAVADGTVYIGSDAVFDADQEDTAPSALYAVDAMTGKERWHTDFGEPGSLLALRSWPTGS